MNLYEIALPDAPNPNSEVTGEYLPKRREWRKLALLLAGGFTEIGRRYGEWQDPKDGRVYSETMHWYQIATTPKIMGELVEHAFELFPDQEAIFYAVVGRAVIVPKYIPSVRGPVRYRPDMSEQGVDVTPPKHSWDVVA